jgi:hypothetical protein
MSCSDGHERADDLACELERGEGHESQRAAQDEHAHGAEPVDE